MADFHRFVTPTYHGGLPGTYDLINVISGGIGSGGSAPADGVKVGGANPGTYWVSFGEDATALHTNRMARALSENTDYLDDVVHRDLAVPVLSAPVTPGAPVSSIALTGDIYVGEPGETNDQRTRSGLVVLLESGGDPLIVENPTGAYSTVLVSKIHDGLGTNVIGAPADGFYTDPTIDLGTTIPSGKTYRVLYYIRDKVETQPAGILSRLRDGVFGDANLWSTMLNYTSFYPAGSNWHDGTTNPVTLVKTQVAKIITDLIANAGSDRIGSAAVAGNILALNAGDSIYDQLSDINTLLNASHLGSIFSVKNYGAVGDNSADDTSEVQAAITAAAVNGGIVWFPDGIYKLSSGLTVPNNVSLWGPGSAVAAIRQTGTTVPLLDCAGSHTYGYTKINGLRLYGDATMGDSLIQYAAGAKIIVEYCYLDGSAGTGDDLIQGPTSGDSDIIVRECYFKASSGDNSIYIQQGNFSIHKCTFEPATSGNATTVRIGNGSYVQQGTISDCTFENSASTSGDFSNISLDNDTSVEITGCRFYDSTGGAQTAISFVGEQSDDVVEDNNYFETGVEHYSFGSVTYDQGDTPKRIRLKSRIGRVYSELDITGPTWTAPAKENEVCVMERTNSDNLEIQADDVAPPGARLVIIMHSNSGTVTTSFDTDDFAYRLDDGSSTEIDASKFMIFEFVSMYMSGALKWCQVSPAFGDISEP